MERIEIGRPDDFHVHFRTGEMLQTVAPLTARHFARALVMPNTIPPKLTSDDAKVYRQEILAAAPGGFEPLMTIKLATTTTPEIIAEAYAAGVVAAKLYPEGVTTNSEDGVRDVRDLWSVFGAMQDVGMVLCLHGEHPEFSILKREKAFLPVLEEINRTFPRLRIVLEHISTRKAVRKVMKMSEMVAATITVHHLALTLDDVLAPKIKPHNFCMPVAKSWKDRRTLWDAVASGNPKFFLGTDSAPHRREDKECANGCAGVFTAPVAMAYLTQMFWEEDLLDMLEQFTSVYGAHFYGLPRNKKRLALVRKPWVVPDMYGDVVPFMAGQTLQWQVEES